MKLHTLFWTGLLSFLLPLGARADDGSQAPISVTEGGSRVVALVAGYRHTCGLKANGSAACWGDNSQGQLGTDAERAGPFIALTGTGLQTCGLKPDGNAICWGEALHVGPFIALATGTAHTCGLKADGTAACWGYDVQHQAPASVPGPFIALAAGGAHTCGLNADGSATCWGDSHVGQLGTPAQTAGPFIAITAGENHTCGLKTDGSAVCWGANDYGQAPITPVTGPFISLAAGTYHTCGLEADGNATCWGSDVSGQAPASVAGPFVSVSAGYLHSCGLKADGDVQCWGAGGPGTSGIPNYGQSTVPSDLGPLGFGQIAAGNAHACQVKRDGTLSCWGFNDEVQATPPATGLFSQVVAGDSHSCAIGTDGKVTCWGRNGSDSTQNSHLTASVWRQLAPSPDGAICALNAGNATHYCIRGQIPGQASGYSPGFMFRNITHGLYATNPKLCGVSFIGGANRGFCNPGFDATHTSFFAGPWQRLESGLNHQCGLKINGTLECWGANTEGQTDDIPTGLFRAFSVGWNHACAIRENGTLACWGSNINGQATPPTGTFVQVAAGNTFTCAIRDVGTRVCWGDDAQGQAPQLQLTPNAIADGIVGVTHANVNLVLGDFGQNAAGHYAPPTPAFAVVAGTLPPGLTLTAAGLLSGTPTTAGPYSFTVEGEDANGFVASRNYSLTIIADTTPPVVSYTLTPAAPNGSNGWYTSNVDITWSVTDAESGISASVGCGPATLSTDATGASWTCTATNGVGLQTVKTVSPAINRDATKPTVVAAATTPANANGWYKADVGVHFTCTDATSGVASCPADQTLTGEGSAISSTAQTSVDNAGNVSAPSNVVTVKIDRTAPTLAPVAPGLVLMGGTYSATVNATDALSGIDTASCPLDASSAGAKTATCTATDKAGNSATAQVSYTVTELRTFQWFSPLPAQQPRSTEVFQVKPGQPILLQFRMYSSSSQTIAGLTTANVISTPIACPSPSSLRVQAPHTGAPMALQFGNMGMYRMTWDVPSAATNSCLRMKLDINDGKDHSLILMIKP